MISSPSFGLSYEDYPVVKLRSLDKITARTMTFEAKVGSTVRFGDIFIKVQSCRKPPPIEKSEAAAFLQVWQSNDIKDTSKWIFSGWMFASSPALSAMDHPVYDVWVLDCLGRDPEPVPVTDTEDEKKGVPAPATDGIVPDAVPPAVEPDKQAPEVPSTADENGPATREDDPGAYDDAPASEETAPEENASQESIPERTVPSGDYAPNREGPETYQDETPADDTAPKDDTTAPAETKPDSSNEFEGIY